jgi:hypothetical protein
VYYVHLFTRADLSTIQKLTHLLVKVESCFYSLKFDIIGFHSKFKGSGLACLLFNLREGIFKVTFGFKC